MVHYQNIRIGVWTVLCRRKGCSGTVYVHLGDLIASTSFRTEWWNTFTSVPDCSVPRARNGVDGRTGDVARSPTRSTWPGVGQPHCGRNEETKRKRDDYDIYIHSSPWVLPCPLNPQVELSACCPAAQTWCVGASSSLPPPCHPTMRCAQAPDERETPTKRGFSRRSSGRCNNHSLLFFFSFFLLSIAIVGTKATLAMNYIWFVVTSSFLSYGGDAMTVFLRVTDESVEFVCCAREVIAIVARKMRKIKTRNHRVDGDGLAR